MPLHKLSPLANSHAADKCINDEPLADTGIMTDYENTKKKQDDDKALSICSEETAIQKDGSLDHCKDRTGTLREILERNHAIAILLGKTKPWRPRAMITLLDNLSAHDTEALHSMMHLVIDLEDDLVKRIAQLHDENNHLRSMAVIDNLTELYNHRFFSAQLKTEMARTRRTGLPCALLMIDLDNFKTLNDTLGHGEGNTFLSTIAKSIREHVRPTDTACRYGGDEFTVIMPDTTVNEASRIALRLKSAIEELSEPLNLDISASIGVAEYTVMSSWDIAEFIDAADSAMYDAKRKGKNRISIAGIADMYEPEAGLVSCDEKEALFKAYDNLWSEGERDGP